MTTHTRCAIREGADRRWFIFSVELDHRAWTGSRWAPSTPSGRATGHYQITHFHSEEAATRAARAFGLEPIDAGEA